MLNFEFNDSVIPLSCITGLSYNRSANIVNNRDLTCYCKGMNPMQVQVQISLSNATCVDNDVFQYLARELSQIRPSKASEPSFITVAGEIIIPQMKFMLASTNITYQSDRLGNLQEMNINWTLAGTRVVKDENREVALVQTSVPTLPKITLHCKGKSVDCANDINVAELHLSGFKGSIQLLLGDTYQDVDRDSWLVDVNNSDDSYFEIEGYGKFYILDSFVITDNWLNFDLTKFNKDWYKNQTETLISDTKSFALSDIFKSADVSSKATFKYLKYDSKPIEMLYGLQDSLGYLIGLRNDQIYLYDTPKEIPKGAVTYDFYVDNDMLTTPITKVILRDGVGEYVAGDDNGETFFVNAICRVAPNAADNVLKYAQFNQNMLEMTIPYESRINIGSIVSVNLGDSIVNCVVTEYDIDFIANQMKLELHYIRR